MMALWLIIVLFGGGLLAWATELADPRAPRIVALLSVLLALLLVLVICATGAPQPDSPGAQWFLLEKWEWIPRFGIFLQFGVDGLSLLMLLLTTFLGLISVAAAWNEIQQRCGFFYFNLLWTLAGVVGVFIALDLFLFFFFWEIMLIPMYLIIAIWGHEDRAYAATKFFIFTQAAGLVLLLAILAMAWLHMEQVGRFSFDYFELGNLLMEAPVQLLLMLGFFIGFATKLPSFPLHSWLPDAHSQAPTAGSVLLAGLLLKTGAYGLIRFTVPLFPDAAADFAPVAMTLGAISILYCAKLAFAQTDLKRLIAYTSVSHMGFVTLGIFAWNIQGLQGAFMTIMAHGLSAAALFMIAGGLQLRFHTRDIYVMGGLWAVLPGMAAMALFFSIAALGMPGLGNFVGEFLSLIGAFQTHAWITVVAALGLILAAVYSLWVIQRVFHGAVSPVAESAGRVPDLSRVEWVAYGTMAAGLVWMGVHPQSFLGFTEPVLQLLLETSQ